MGWCSSELDAEMWDGDVSELGDKTADDCWTECQAKFSPAEPRHQFWNDGTETRCYCQNGCLGICDVGEAATLAPPDWDVPNQADLPCPPDEEEEEVCTGQFQGVIYEGDQNEMLKSMYIQDKTGKTCGTKSLWPHCADDPNDSYDAYAVEDNEEGWFAGFCCETCEKVATDRCIELAACHEDPSSRACGRAVYVLTNEGVISDTFPTAPASLMKACKSSTVECYDTNEKGAVGKSGEGCELYGKAGVQSGAPDLCGNFDDDDFHANSMCCLGCGGGAYHYLPTDECQEEICRLLQACPGEYSCST